MRSIHVACSSTLVLSLMAACSGAPPAGQDGSRAQTALSSSAGHARVMRVRGGQGIVGGSCASGRTLSNPNNNPVMHGTVNIYLITYGFVASSVTNVLTGYIADVNESSYLAMNSVYTDSNGPTTSTISVAGLLSDSDIAAAAGLPNGPYSQGMSLTDGDILTEIRRAIQFNVLPSDPNGIYYVLTDNAVSETNGTSSFCSGGPQPYCAWHNHADNSGTDIKYAFLGDPGACAGGCEWGVAQSPNGIQGDSAVSIFTHELIETLTDPDLNAWTVDSSLTENGDLCNQTAGATYTQTAADRSDGAAGGGTSDLHLGQNDYLVQMDWVNPVSSGEESYGLPFWNQNFGYTGLPIQDWAFGSFKAQCSSGQPVTGVSEDPSETFVHSALCASGPTWPAFVQGTDCYGLPFDPGDNMMTNVDGDWDRNFYKAECRTNEFVAGVSQSTSGQLDGIMCCPGGVTHAACDTEVFLNQNSADYTAPDWDFGFYKGQCAAGKYLAGVSATIDGLGSGHALLCCAP